MVVENHKALGLLQVRPTLGTGLRVFAAGDIVNAHR
jgi:hypothetical protein